MSDHLIDYKMKHENLLCLSGFLLVLEFEMLRARKPKAIAQKMASRTWTIQGLIDLRG